MKKRSRKTTAISMDSELFELLERARILLGYKERSRFYTIAAEEFVKSRADKKTSVGGGEMYG